VNKAMEWVRLVDMDEDGVVAVGVTFGCDCCSYPVEISSTEKAIEEIEKSIALYKGRIAHLEEIRDALSK